MIRTKEVRDDTSTIIRNVVSISKDYAFKSINHYNFGSYPMCYAISEFIFYLPNFLRLRVYTKPTDFNGTIVDSLQSMADNLVRASKIFSKPIPSIRSFYKCFSTVSMPYTTINWGTRVGAYRFLNSNIIDKTKHEYSLYNIFCRFGSGGVAGAFSAFLTVPMLKLQLANQLNLAKSNLAW